MAIPIYTGGGHLYADAPRQPAIQLIDSGMESTYAGMGQSVETRVYLQPGLLLTIGSEGTAVLQLQQDLNDLGFPVGPEDGVYGPQTADGVETFQRSGRRITIDGIVGPETKQKLTDWMLSSLDVEIRPPESTVSQPGSETPTGSDTGGTDWGTVLRVGGIAAGVGLTALYFINQRG